MTVVNKEAGAFIHAKACGMDLQYSGSASIRKSNPIKVIQRYSEKNIWRFPETGLPPNHPF
jgi:hypothetical protein